MSMNRFVDEIEFIRLAGIKLARNALDDPVIGRHRVWAFKGLYAENFSRFRPQTKYSRIPGVLQPPRPTAAIVHLVVI